MFVWQKRLKRSVGIFLILMLVFSSCLIAAPFQSLAAAEESPGVLILAHGAGDPIWTVPLWEAANELKENLPYPVAIGFLEYDEPVIPDAVEQLNAVGVNKIVAVPLFISSYSNHIEEIKYILGLRKDLPDPDEDLERASPAGEVILIPAVDDHPLMAEVLTEQIKPLIKDPAHEVVVLAAHGSDSEEGKIGWKNNLESLGQQIQKRLAAQGTPVKGIRYGYVFEGPTPSLRKAVDEAINTDGATALVVPVMVSEGFFTGRMIPNILKEFADDTYRYPEPGQRALLTFKKAHANRIVEWRAANELWPQPEVIKDGKRLHLTLDKCQEIAQAAGKGYPCSVLAFRMAGVALPALWPDSPVVADDLTVVSLLPPEAGSKPVFDYLSGDVSYLGNWKKITPLSPTFIFANKATGETVWVQVKPDTFGGEDYFGLRNRVINGQAAEGEQAGLQACLDELLKNLLARPAEAICAWKKVSPLSVYSPDDKLLKFSYMDIAVEDEGLCLGRTFGFQALSEAFAELYGDSVPKQGRFSVLAHLPTKCTEGVLKVVAGAGNYELSGTDPVQGENYCYEVTAKDRSRVAVVKVKPSLIPEEFFTLRNKCKQGKATPDEKARFQELKLQAIISLMFKPTDEIFSVSTHTVDMQGDGVDDKDLSKDKEKRGDEKGRQDKAKETTGLPKTGENILPLYLIGIALLFAGTLMVRRKQLGHFERK